MRTVLPLILILVPAVWLSVPAWSYARPDTMIAPCIGKPLDSLGPPENTLRVPLPTEVQEPNPVIARLFDGCAERIENEGIEAALPYFDGALAMIEAKHGRHSIAYADCLSQIIAYFDGAAPNRHDLILTYSEASVSVSRKVYGTNHRETAAALYAHASRLISMSKDSYSDAAIPYLRESMEIRNRVLGAGHEETAIAASQLARLLLAKWRQSDNQDTEIQLFNKARILAEQATQTIRKSRPPEDSWRGGAEVTLGSIAYIEGDYEKALMHFRAEFTSVEVAETFKCLLRYDACKDYAATLRTLGHEEEAAALEKRIGPAPATIRGKQPPGEGDTPPQSP